MNIDQFLRRTDKCLLKKAKNCRNIDEFTDLMKDNNIEITGEDLKSAYYFICNKEEFEKLMEDSLYIVAGGKSKHVDAEAVCSQFVASKDNKDEESIDNYCCDKCIHKVIAPKTIFLKERLTCKIGRGQGYRDPNNLI